MSGNANTRKCFVDFCFTEDQMKNIDEDTFLCSFGS